MPELPEVETIVRELRSCVSGKSISRVREFRTGTIENRVGGTTIGEINEISRRGKYICILTAGQIKLIIHLRMTGKLIYEANPDMSSDHCRAEIEFSDATRLLFDDIRTFGTIVIAPATDNVPGIQSLGPEPLSQAFSPDYLAKTAAGRKAPIKNLLLNQEVVAGLGNIYAAEILYRCRIDPRRESNCLTDHEIASMVQNTKQVLAEAIANNGTTVSDYARIDEKKGTFQNFLRVYKKEKCSCGKDISKIKMAGRSTWFCPACQH